MMRVNRVIKGLTVRVLGSKLEKTCPGEFLCVVTAQIEIRASALFLV